MWRATGGSRIKPNKTQEYGNCDEQQQKDCPGARSYVTWWPSSFSNCSLCPAVTTAQLLIFPSIAGRGNLSEKKESDRFGVSIRLSELVQIMEPQMLSIKYHLQVTQLQTFENNSLLDYQTQVFILMRNVCTLKWTSLI